MVDKFFFCFWLVLGEQLGLIDFDVINLFWIIDFFMFEWNSDEKCFEVLYYFFIVFYFDDLGDLKIVWVQVYDLVMNGVEIGGGSLWIY